MNEILFVKIITTVLISLCLTNKISDFCLIKKLLYVQYCSWRCRQCVVKAIRFPPLSRKFPLHVPRNFYPPGEFLEGERPCSTYTSIIINGRKIHNSVKKTHSYFVKTSYYPLDTPSDMCKRLAAKEY